MRLSRHSYSTLQSIQGPLVFVEKVIDARMGESVRIVFPDGREAEGEVLRIEHDTVLIQVIGDSRGLDMDHTQVVFTDALKRAPLSLAVLNRTFNGSFQPIDDLPMFVPEQWAPVTGFPLNPVARERPQEMIETGLSCIDGLNTLVKGQKLPIFSCAGLPSREVAARILEHARAADAAGTGPARVRSSCSSRSGWPTTSTLSTGRHSSGCAATTSRSSTWPGTRSWSGCSRPGSA